MLMYLITDKLQLILCSVYYFRPVISKRYCAARGEKIFSNNLYRVFIAPPQTPTKLAIDDQSRNGLNQYSTRKEVEFQLVCPRRAIDAVRVGCQGIV